MSYYADGKSNGSNFTFRKSDNKTELYWPEAVSYTRLTTVLLLRAGYVIIQISAVPVNDVHEIIFQNVVDIAVSTCSYLLLGYMLSFGNESLGGFIGSTASFYGGDENVDEMIYGFSACLISSSIITTTLAGRVSSMSSAGISFLNAGLVQPTIIHWAWNRLGWMAHNRIHNIIFAVKDHAGTMVIHLGAGMTALWGSVCLGRRLVRLKELHVSSLGAASPALSFIGYILVLIGLTTFALPRSQQKLIVNRITSSKYAGSILVNCMTAISSSCLSVLLLQCFCFGRSSGHWTLLKCMQGGVAGLVITCAGADIYDRLTTFLIAALGAFFYYITTLMTETMFYEDHCNMIPAHLVCGFLGAIFPTSVANLGESSGSENTTVNLRLYQTLWQVMCACVIAIWSTLFFLPLFVFLQTTGLLANRNEELNHLRSQNVIRNIGNRSSVWRIFTYGDVTPILTPGVSRQGGDSELEKLKNRYERRRDILEKVMAKRQKKRSEPTIIVEQPLVIPVEEIVEDMGILESQRYPARYDEILEKRLNKDPTFVYTALNNTTMSPFEKNQSTSGPPKTGPGENVPQRAVSMKENVKKEVHENQTEGNRRPLSSSQKKHLMSARQRTRRKRAKKRLDSALNAKCNNRKERR